MSYYNVHVNNRDLLESINENGVFLRSSSGESMANTPYNELITAEKTTLIELKSIYGISDLRDMPITTGTGNVSNDLREYECNVTGTSSSARLSSRERGRYIAGKSAEYGIGIRTNVSNVTGDTVLKWGALNDTNGMYFGADSNGIFVAILDDNTETKIYQSDWNLDKLDGNGDSGETLSLPVANIFQVEFTWYGYGVITFRVQLKTTKGMRLINCHRYVVDGKTSIQNPNLPITALVEQTTSNDDVSIFVAGRQFSILGTYSPSFRTVSDYRLNRTVPTLSTNPTPILAFRQKTLNRAVNGKFSGIDVVTDNQIIIEVYIADESDLTGANWQTPTRKIPTETAFEVDRSATAFDASNGDILYRDIIQGGAGGNRTTQRDIKDLLLDIPEGKILVITAFATDTTASVNTVPRIREEW